MKILKNSKSGFTLIEISIVLTIIGIILAALITPYKIYRAELARKTTVSNIEQVNLAISNFLIQNGRYPCPAPLTAGPGDANFGVETVCDPSDPGYPTYTYGDCTGGLCFEQSKRLTVDTNPGPGPGEVTMEDAVVRRGSVPFRSLGLAELETIDGYKARLQYAVSENLAVASSFVQDSGGISLIDKSNNTLIEPADTAHYLIFSTGKDKNGAYTREGFALSACDTSRADGENCNTSNSGLDKKAIYAFNEYNDSGNADHYDDVMKHFSSVETPLWQIADSGGYHIRDLLGGGSGQVAIGSPTPQEQLDIGGEIRVEDDGTNTLGKSKFNEICDKTINGCFSVEEFGGSHANFRCGETGDAYSDNDLPYAYGFADGKIKCSNAPAETECPPGTKLRGIDSDGALDCETLVGCPSKNVTLCSVVQTLAPKIYRSPSNDPNNKVTLTAGVTKQEVWRCRSNGNWTRHSYSGSCSCTPNSSTTTETCTSYKGKGYWTGTVNITTNTTCSPGPVTTKTVSGAGSCACDGPKTETAPDNCPTGYTGSPTKTRDWTCAATASSGSWGTWSSNKATACTCNSSATDTQDFSCPPGYDDPSGKITKERTYDCTATPTGWGAWSEIANTCTCNGKMETVITGCSSGDPGNIKKERQFNCVTDTWGPWITTNSCGAVSYYWKNKSSAKGPFGSSISPFVGDSCISPGDKQPCSSPTATGSYMHYNVCECE
jgi:prepilin-type N-terminal cleavage/methylation domain-containing protein